MTSLPALSMDATDRNRTSPFAFTGNKFEFRAVGSSAPIYWPQTVLNVAVADSLKQLADALESLKPGDFEGLTGILSAIVERPQAGPVRGQRLLRGVARRGGEARPAEQQDDGRRPAGAGAPKAKKLFSSFGVLSERELASRVEISWEHYVKVSNIEASCALDIARTMILPAAARYLGELRRRAHPARRAASATVCDRVGGLDRPARRGDRRARARPARGPRGRHRAGRGRGRSPMR